MTTTTQTVSAQYVGDGSSTAFNVQFPFARTSDVLVYLIDSVGSASLQTYGTHYTIVGSDCRFVTAPGADKLVLLKRKTLIDQQVNLVAHDVMPAETIEGAYDKLTRIAQELETRVTTIENSLPFALATVTPETYQLPASILLLLNTIEGDALIPSGYNGLSIDPTIVGTVRVDPGSEWFIAAPGGGIGVGGGFATLGDNTFVGVQDFGTPGGSFMRISPSTGDFYINRSDDRQPSPVSGEHNGFAADITCSSGSSSIVPIHSHALGNGSFSGNVWGIATEAYNGTSRSGGGLSSQLFGGEFSVLNLISTSTAWRHAGVLVVFKNRLDIQDTPVNGVPAGGNAYNKNTSAIYVDTGAGRIGSASSTSAGNSAIECGWNKGIYFSPPSLDTAAGVPAVGIDFSALDASAPEGGKYSDRVRSFLALPDTGAITFSTDGNTAQLRYSPVGTLEIQNTGAIRHAFAVGTGTYFQYAGYGVPYTCWINLGNDTTTEFMSLRSGAKTATPSVPGTIAGWLGILVDGVHAAIPFYQ